MNMFNFTQNFFVSGLSSWGTWSCVFALCDLVVHTALSIAFSDLIHIRVSLRGFKRGMK